MSDSKKLDHILKQVKKTNIMLESISMVINSIVVGVMVVVAVKTIFNR